MKTKQTTKQEFKDYERERRAELFNGLVLCIIVIAVFFGFYIGTNNFFIKVANVIGIVFVIFVMVKLLWDYTFKLNTNEKEVNKK